MSADSANEKKAKKAMLIPAAEESVNMLSAFSLNLFVKGTAEDAADINRYAIICSSITQISLLSKILLQ